MTAPPRRAVAPLWTLPRRWFRSGDAASMVIFTFARDGGGGLRLVMSCEACDTRRTWRLNPEHGGFCGVPVPGQVLDPDEVCWHCGTARRSEEPEEWPC